MNKVTFSFIFLKKANIISTPSLLIMVVIIIFVIIGLGLLLICRRRKSKYPDIRPYKQDIKNITEVAYFEDIPCAKQLNTIYFLADYYGILKNRADFIGMILFKWYLTGYITIDEEKKRIIILKDYLASDYEGKLFAIIKECATHGYYDIAKMDIYLKSNYYKILDFYDALTLETVENAVNNEKLNLVKIHHNVYKKMTETLWQEANNILGLKKYLLHFNQVPRRAKLTPDTYKYLLYISILLGISKDFGDEIVRKNPRNVLAKEMLKFINMKDIYISIYDDALKYNKMAMKKKD